MIHVDRRTGSKELADPLQKRGLPVVLEELGFGDFFWLGNGPGGDLVPVGVELKTFGDLLSCIVNGRFADHQLPGLRDSYEVWWILVEGDWHPQKDGRVLLRKRPVSWGNREWSYRGIMGWLFSMVYQGGGHVWPTKNRDETLQWLHSHYTWWTAEEWDQHRSVTAIKPPLIRSLTRPSLTARMASLLPGIGGEFAKAVDQVFGARMRKALHGVFGPEELAEVSVERNGRARRLGEKTAKRVVEALR